MRALRKVGDGRGNMQLGNVPVPALGPKDILMKVWAVGVCESDLEIQEGSHLFKAPVTLGHEFSGTVEKIGSQVTTVKAGDRVVADIEVLGGWLGVTEDGAYAEYIKVNEHAVFKLPDSVSLDAGVFVEPIVGIVHSLQERIDISAGDFVVILDPGPNGLIALQFAQLRGGVSVVMVAQQGDEFRMELAKKLGADGVYYLDDETSQQKIIELSDGGADFIANCSKNEVSLQFAVNVAKPAHEGIGGKGKIALLSTFSKPVTISFDKAAMGQLDFRGGRHYNGPETWVRAIDLLEAGKFDCDMMITHRYLLEEWEQAFADVREHKVGKALIYPNGYGWAN